MKLVSAIMLALLLSCPQTEAASSYWAPHWDAKMSAAVTHSGNVGTRNVLILSDSILEGFWWNQMQGHYIVNCGMGGIGIDGVLARADYILQMMSPRVVIVMVGINDCTEGTEMDGAEWIAKYETLLMKIAAANSTAVVCSILPIASGKALSPLFDVMSQRDKNTRLYNMCVRLNQIFLNLNAWFAPPPDYMYMYSSLTNDGVHPYAAGMSQLYYAINSVLAQAWDSRTW